jgi:site-specific DNA-methyltransferase (adenine-specific)
MRTRNNGRYNGNGREWETPPEVFAPLEEEFRFTLDPCATPANAKCPRFFTETEDGLIQDWGTERVFMNPPYGREVAAWTAKAKAAAAAGAFVVGLLPASTDLAWWYTDIVGVGAEVRYIRGRVRFLTGGLYRASGFFASVIVVWRPPTQLNERCRACGGRGEVGPYLDSFVCAVCRGTGLAPFHAVSDSGHSQVPNEGP